jgi:predicted oxidoreductase (fatty acid repression mutant protein)
LENWLDDDEAAAATRKELEAKHVEYAKNYLVFEQDARARAILAQWEAAMLKKRTPVGASLQQYAAEEAVRAFVASVIEQVRIGREGKV